MNIVIAGFGVAGCTAAEAARKQNPKAYITIFGQEKDMFYYRVRLPEVVSGELSPEKIIAHPQSWYDERGIEVRLGESLSEVYLEEKIIRGSMGSRQEYDKILLAVGAEANRGSYPGDRLEGIYTVRTLNDAWKLSYDLKEKRNAVLIGCGLLGLEIGYSLAKQGMDVTALDISDRILPRQTTPDSSNALKYKLDSLGFKFKLSCDVDRFEGRHKVERIIFKDGTELPADLVVISAGVTPNLNLASTLGLKTDRGILVDEYMQTSVPDIYAAGDCAQAVGAIGGLWSTARDQGLIAGANMVMTNAGDRKKYQPVLPANTLKIAGIDFTSAGNLDPESSLCSVVATTNDTYRKVTLDAESCVVGFTNVGTTVGNKALGKALADCQKITPDTVKELASPDFDFDKF